MTAGVREKVKRSSVYIRCLFNSGRGATGSGFVEKETKYVVTNAHVIGIKTELQRERDRRKKKEEEDKDEMPDKDGKDPKDGKEKPKEKPKTKDKKGMVSDDRGPKAIELIFNSGEGDKEISVPGRLIAFDEVRDLAVIAPARPAGDTTLVLDGLVVPKTTKVVELQRLFIFGFPLGEDAGKEISIADVSVTSIRKGGDGRLPMIQFKGGSTFGNSGGPIVDGRGNVVGVSVAGFAGTDINLAIPGDAIHEFFKKNDVK